MRYLRICSLYTSTAMISLILLFLPFLVIAIPEQNYHSGTLTLITQKNKISELMTVNASILLKSELVTVFAHLLLFVLQETGLSLLCPPGLKLCR